MKQYGPIKKTEDKFYKVILENIRAMFINGDLKSGEKMPSERELAEYFQVSRVPVREALKILEYMGVLEQTSGEGLYIRNVSASDMMGKLDFAYIATSRAIHDLFELRVSIESTATYYAAIRRTEQDILSLKKSVEDMRAALKKSTGSEEDEGEIRAASHEFHINLIKASKNSVLQSVYENLYDLLDISKQYTLHGPESTGYGSLLAHEAILAKVMQKDSDGARNCMIEHLNVAQEKLDQGFAESTPV